MDEKVDYIHLGGLQARWCLKRKTPERWSIIREAYEIQMPHILAARARYSRSRTDPYFLDWDFTPIEFLAWQDVRSMGLPFYPQVPVGKCFLDFGDPHFKIGVELDGKDYHDAKKDRERDENLWERYGWRIFRIPGRQSFPLKGDQYEKSYEWYCHTSEGVFWSIDQMYYTGKPSENSQEGHDRLAIAQRSLEMHQHHMFPIEL